MWMMKRRSSSQCLKSHFEVSVKCLSDSWEEKTFAEDAARCLRGCIWPPRSYSCRFCSREFRSAQALGGHRNVHRRDRAKLKQSLKDPNNEKVVEEHSIDDHSRVSALSTQENSSISSIVEEEQKGKLFGSDFTAKRPLNDMISGSDDVETSLSVGLSSVLFQNRPTVTCNKEAINNKRPKVAVSTLQYSPLQGQVLELKPACSMEELDLELRLGVLQ